MREITLWVDLEGGGLHTLGRTGSFHRPQTTDHRPRTTDHCSPANRAALRQRGWGALLGHQRVVRMLFGFHQRQVTYLHIIRSDTQYWKLGLSPDSAAGPQTTLHDIPLEGGTLASKFGPQPPSADSLTHRVACGQHQHSRMQPARGSLGLR